MMDGDRAHVESLPCFGRDCAENGLDHFGIRFVLERGDGSAARVVADAPDERHHAAAAGPAHERTDPLFVEWCRRQREELHQPPAIGGNSANSSPSESTVSAGTTV